MTKFHGSLGLNVPLLLDLALSEIIERKPKGKLKVALKDLTDLTSLH